MRTHITVLIVLTLVSICAAVPVQAQDAAPAPAVAAATPPQTALITPDTDIFRRTPTIDGIVEDGEWDAFYTYVAGDWHVTTYANWDGRNIYIGAKSDKPIDLLGVVDADADGWFHGEENYEFRAARNTDGSLALTVCSYESRNTKSPVATPLAPAEAALVELKSTKSNDAYMLEMRVPMLLIRDVKFSPGKKIGFQINVKTTTDDTGWVPANQVGDVKECALVTKKFATLKPLALGFDLRDIVLARGEELVGKFHLTNEGAETIDARNFIVAGEGKAGDYLSSQKIRIEGLAPKKHMAQEVRTIIPTDMPLGSWAIGAEVRSGDTRLGAALVSFDVVEPYEIELRLPTNEVSAAVKDVAFNLVVKNNCRHSIRGTAKITLPIGWELWKNADSRDFTVDSSGGVASVQFKAKPPLGELGSVPVKAEVTVGADTKTVEGKFTVVNP